MEGTTGVVGLEDYEDVADFFNDAFNEEDADDSDDDGSEYDGATESASEDEAGELGQEEEDLDSVDQEEELEETGEEEELGELGEDERNLLDPIIGKKSYVVMHSWHTNFFLCDSLTVDVMLIQVTNIKNYFLKSTTLSGLRNLREPT
jgi:hypothetical protein